MTQTMTAKEFGRAVGRVKDAIADRPFGYDLDKDRRGHRETPAFEEFEKLFDKSGGYLNYYDAVEASGSGIPVLRSNGTNIERLRAELAHVERLERGLFVRVDVSSTRPIATIARECISMGLENVVFVLDCGWHSSLLVYQAKCIALLKLLLTSSGDFEFVVAGGDFPSDGFADKGIHFRLSGEERLLVEAVRREVNEADIVFGDWASTRLPATDDKIRRGGRPRIDMPTRDGWECWRKAQPGKSFKEPAAAAAGSRRLKASSDFWGEQVIIATRDGEDSRIKSALTASAVRINLHMMLQAHFDEGSGPHLGDELVTDEL